jgi:pimeloyl-ACP methyl ester carboxylesterase
LKGLGLAIAAIVIGNFVALCVLALRPASTPPIDGENAIASLETISLGGVDQTILVRGRNRSAPVLLYIHGGPGFAQIPLARFYSDALEEQFVVVHWDQRGAGASCDGTDFDALTLDGIVDDTIELSQVLASRFGGAGRIVLLGHSWGSIVGALAVQQRPDLYHAYVGLGQLVDGRRNEVLSYDWVVREAERRGDLHALTQLRTVSPPYAGNDELGIQRRWLMTYGGSVYATDRAQAALWPVFFAPEYTLGTRLAYPGCFSSSINAMWEHIDGIDLKSQIPRLEVPVYFFTGRNDWNTPYPLIEEWASKLDAPSVEIVWFEGAGHMVPMESPVEFQRALLDQVLPRVH